MRPATFFAGNLVFHKLCSKHFLIQSVFFAAFSGEVNLLFHSSITLIANLLQLPNSTPGGNRHMRSLNFCRKFNSRQLLFEAFFLHYQYFLQRSALKSYFPMLVH